MRQAAPQELSRVYLLRSGEVEGATERARSLERLGGASSTKSAGPPLAIGTTTPLEGAHAAEVLLHEPR